MSCMYGVCWINSIKGFKEVEHAIGMRENMTEEAHRIWFGHEEHIGEERMTKRMHKLGVEVRKYDYRLELIIWSLKSAQYEVTGTER